MFTFVWLVVLVSLVTLAFSSFLASTFGAHILYFLSLDQAYAGYENA
jgi:hypothetical protein